jgi:hypothetical protein
MSVRTPRLLAILVLLFMPEDRYTVTVNGHTREGLEHEQLTEGLLITL